MFCSLHIFMDVCLILLIAHKILFIFFFCHVRMFSSIFSSWLTCLSLRFDYSLNFKICNKRLKTFFFKRKKNQICIFIKYRFGIFLHTKQIYIFIKYRSEIFFHTKLICIFIKYISEIFFV